jgi:hypothetical protein
MMLPDSRDFYTAQIANTYTRSQRRNQHLPGRRGLVTEATMNSLQISRIIVVSDSAPPLSTV